MRRKKFIIIQMRFNFGFKFIFIANAACFSLVSTLLSSNYQNPVGNGMRLQWLWCDFRYVFACSQIHNIHLFLKEEGNNLRMHFKNKYTIWQLQKRKSEREKRKVLSYGKSEHEKNIVLLSGRRYSTSIRSSNSGEG